MDTRPKATFVGRFRELDELERALGTTRNGNGASVLVGGEAGIGKTRLASELATRAREAGFEILLGHSIDLVGTVLPYQPFVEALRPLGPHSPVNGRTSGSQLGLFEETLAVLTDRAAAVPVLLVLEDLHWADTSTLDLVVFLAHNLNDRRVLLVATYRADEPKSAQRLRRFAHGVMRSGAAFVLELGPLEREDLTALLAAQADVPPPAALSDAIMARSEGNPFFAEELLASAGDGNGELPGGLRDLLLERVSRLDRPTQCLLRLAAAAGREVGYPLLRATATVSEQDVRESLRHAVEHGVMVPEPATASFRFRHALLAEAIYATIMPGEREELHGRLAEQLARSAATAPAELASHWAAAGRNAEALAASVEAARQAEAMFGLAEARAHLERVLTLWDAVPDAAELAKVDLADLCSRAAELASQTAGPQRAVELGRRAIALVGADDPHRAAILHVRLGEYLLETGDKDAGLAALERAVEVVPVDPPSPELAYSLGSLAGGLMVDWHYAESLPISEEALTIARRVDAREAEVRALTVLAGDLAYLGRTTEGVAHFRHALKLAEEIGDTTGLERAHVNFTDALTMLGRARESVRLGRAGIGVMRRFGIASTLLVSNLIEALLELGEWDEADRLIAAEFRGISASHPYMPLIIRAILETGRGDFVQARAHLDAARPVLRLDCDLAMYDGFVAELALWERRWTDADEAVGDGLARTTSRETAQIRVRLCAAGLRAQADLAALARARRDTDAVQGWLGRARERIAMARRAADEASAITPNAAGWLALAEAEYARAHDIAPPAVWSAAATAWEQLERPPLTAYCRWREAEALVAAGASRTEATAPLRKAHTVATRLRAEPLLRELELLAGRARLHLTSPDPESPEPMSANGEKGLDELLGLTPREAEVLTLVARGLTDREIAGALVISVKTAGVHVSHILRKLDVPNRRDAAAIAHRVSRPG